MKTTEEKIAIMQAYEDGKEIEYSSGDYPTWKKAATPVWDWSAYDYRVKPEPEYIPFTFEDAEFLIGKAVKSKATKSVYMIIHCDKVGTSLCGGYQRLLDDYTFLDGSPCGKIKK